MENQQRKKITISWKPPLYRDDLSLKIASPTPLVIHVRLVSAGAISGRLRRDFFCGGRGGGGRELLGPATSAVCSFVARHMLRGSLPLRSNYIILARCVRPSYTHQTV